MISKRYDRMEKKGRQRGSTRLGAHQDALGCRAQPFVPDDVPTGSTWVPARESPFKGPFSKRKSNQIRSRCGPSFGFLSESSESYQTTDEVSSTVLGCWIQRKAKRSRGASISSSCEDGDREGLSREIRRSLASPLLQRSFRRSRRSGEEVHPSIGTCIMGRLEGSGGTSFRRVPCDTPVDLARVSI